MVGPRMVHMYLTGRRNRERPQGVFMDLVRVGVTVNDSRERVK